MYVFYIRMESVTDPQKELKKSLECYLLHVWFNLSDEGIEDAIYDSYALRKFMSIDFKEEQVPDATTLLKFRHLLEKNHLREQMFKAINYVLEQGGAMMKGGTIICYNHQCAEFNKI